MAKELTPRDIEVKIKMLEAGEWQARMVGCFEMAVVAQEAARTLRRPDVTHYWYYRSLNPRGNIPLLKEEQRKFERDIKPTLSTLSIGSTSRARTDIE